MNMISLETIKKDTLWVAKMYCGRHIGTYDEVGKYSKDEECREFDIAANQPEHLKEFYDGYFNYCDNNGWTTIPDYYALSAQ